MKEFIGLYRKIYYNAVYLYIIPVITLFLSYGFYASNYSYHIDSLITEYYDDVVMIGAGRWASPIIHWITNWMKFSPFWHTCVMCIFLFCASVVYSVLLYKVSNQKINKHAILVFMIFFLNYPIIQAQLTFPILNIALSYLLIAIALWECWVDTPTLKNYIIAVISLIVGIDMYESFAAVFLVGLFGTVSIKMFFNESDGKFKNFKEIFIFCLKPVIILAISVMIDLIISKLACRVFCGTFDFWYDSNTSIGWLSEYGAIDNAIWLIRCFIANYIIASATNLAIFLFDLSVIILIFLAIFFSVKKRIKILLLYF